jgi:two-component system sensor histidine kinase PilS (NtrC family)
MISRTIPQFWISPDQWSADSTAASAGELRGSLPWIIGIRAVLLFTGLNLAEPLGILPSTLGRFQFLPFFNIVVTILTLSYLLLWWSGKILTIQIYLQIGLDLFLTTLLVTQTHGIESPFLSLYLLLIIYCSLALGRIGGLAGAALSTNLYAGIVVAQRFGIFLPGTSELDLKYLTFRVTTHALGFFAVAFLGAYLSERLQSVQAQLQEKIYSLHQLQRLNEHIASSIRSGLITTDLEGRIALFNDTAEELTERDSEIMLGQPVQPLIGGGSWDKIKGTDMFRHLGPLRFEEWHMLPNGTRRYLGYGVSPLVDQTSRLLGYIISFQDLTALRQLEDEVRVKNQMAVVGRMAAGIAHEIRNPLTSMRGSVEIMRSRPNLSTTEERLLDIIIRESDRLNKFVEDFLQFARPASKNRAAVDLAGLLRDAVTLLRNSPEVRDKHEVVLKLVSGEIPILGNEDQLRQVFWNLAQNALRAMPAGGTLTIEARCAENGSGGQVVFQDTGIGMSEEERNLLFQPFNSSFRGGIGLGLSISFQIIEDHQGKISFESEKGCGTKVTVYIPRQPVTKSPRSNQ